MPSVMILNAPVPNEGYGQGVCLDIPKVDGYPPFVPMCGHQAVVANISVTQKRRRFLSEPRKE